MRDRPRGAELADLARRARRRDPALKLPDDGRYLDAMIARAEAVAARQEEIGEAPERREADSLAKLLAMESDLAALNRTLAGAIRGGRFDPGTSGAAACYRHLWLSSLERVRESNPKALAALGLE